MIFNIYKQRGETPLEALQKLKAAKPELKGEKMTYLGRLDPMAEGVLLIATGLDTEQKRKEEFLSLDKEYDFTVLFGFSSDTYDILGEIKEILPVIDLSESEIIKVIQIYVGERDQKYPPFSSKTVGGRALHEWARIAELDKIVIPSRKITIHKINFKGLQKLLPKELLGRLLMDISKVKGDFRQHVALVLWKKFLENYHGSLYMGSFSAHVSSGTYIRSIVNDLGNTLGCGACALSITRTRVGDYKIEESLSLNE
ncbi:MAG TPA: hypothetical protein VJH67_01490 [Candidatus Paceibacterota bacterium]